MSRGKCPFHKLTRYDRIRGDEYFCKAQRIIINSFVLKRVPEATLLCIVVGRPELSSVFWTTVNV